MLLETQYKYAGERSMFTFVCGSNGVGFVCLQNLEDDNNSITISRKDFDLLIQSAKEVYSK